MKLGLHLANLTYGVEAAGFGAKLDEVVSGPTRWGFDRISVMDQYFQIPASAPPSTRCSRPTASSATSPRAPPA